MEPKSKTASKMLRSDVRGQVLEFNARFNVPIGDRIGWSNPVNTDLRVKLVLEEAQEFHDAVAARDFIKAVDALADLLYVAEGAIIAFGLHHRNCMGHVSDEIQASNMSKLGSDGKPIKREDGKVLKGPHYFPANVEGVLRSFGWTPE